MTKPQQWDGYPVNADVDGWHCIIGYPDNKIRPVRWTNKFGWHVNRWFQPQEVAPDFEYHGPCVPYTEAFAAGARAAREQAVAFLTEQVERALDEYCQEKCDTDWRYENFGRLCASNDALRAIKSLPLPSCAESLQRVAESAAPENAANIGENLSATGEMQRGSTVDLSGLESLVVTLRSGTHMMNVVDIADEIADEIEKLKGK